MAILVAVDEEQRTDRAVAVAYDLATAYDDRLVALHVVPDEEFQSHQQAIADAGFANFSYAQEEGSAARFADRVVDEALEEYDGSIVETRGRVGDPPEKILDEAEALDPRFLVIGGQRRSPVGKALFGNATQKILLNADCPVVTSMSG